MNKRFVVLLLLVAMLSIGIVQGATPISRFYMVPTDREIFYLPDYDIIVHIEGTDIIASNSTGGLVDNGTAGTDDSDVIQSAVTATPDGGVLVLAPGSYTLTTKVSGTKSITIKGYGAVVGYTVTWGAMEFIGTAKADTVLTANADFQDADIHVTSAANCAEGDLVKVWDTSAFTSTYPNIKYGEITRIRSISVANLFIQDSIIGGYITGNTATATPITPITVNVYGIKFSAPDKTGAYNAIRIQYGADGKVIDCTFDPVAQIGLELRDCYGYTVENNHFNGGNAAGYGYGIAVEDASRNILITGNEFKNCRHGVTISYYLNTITGESANIVIENNIFTGSGISTPIDAHLAHSWVVRGNTIDCDLVTSGAETPDDYTAIANGAKSAIIENNVIRNARGIVSTRSNVLLRTMILRNNVGYIYQDVNGYGAVYLPTGAATGSFDTLVIDGNTVYNGTLANVAMTTITHLTISNNKVIGYTASNSGDPGIYLNGYKDVIISNNLISDASGHGMQIRDCNGTITGNRVFNAARNGASTKYGIYLTSVTAPYSHLLVADNYVEETDLISAYGIAENDANSDNVFKNNRIVGYATSPYLITGTTSKGLFSEGATASVTDGATVTHSLSATPVWCIATPTVTNQTVSVTTLAATTFTVAIKKNTDGSAGTSQTIYWRCGL